MSNTDYKVNIRKKEQRPLRKIVEYHEEEGYDILKCGHKYEYGPLERSRCRAARLGRARRAKSRRCNECPLNLDVGLIA